MEPEFPCPTCGNTLVWDEIDPDLGLACVNPQCAALGLTLPVSLVHAHQVRRGRDVPAPGAGWPRPRLPGHGVDGDIEPLPHPYVAPVSHGRVWHRLVDSDRVREIQEAWACQVCGLALDEAAWVFCSESGEVLTDAALHRRCVVLARIMCPHLAATCYRELEVRRGDLLVDDHHPRSRAVWTVKAELRTK
ncbi:hypothetical protein ACWEV3_42975, partial [Saccharopolyspora sp. NPDC003752]